MTDYALPPLLTREIEQEIRASIEAEDEARQRLSEEDLKKRPHLHQNARHRRILLAEVDRLREIVRKVPT
jgi:hypothetical protein